MAKLGDTILGRLETQDRQQEQSDIPGFVLVDGLYYPEDRAQEVLATGKTEGGLTREQAIMELAKSEGIRNPEGDPETLLQQILERRKGKTKPEYQSSVERPGL